MLSVNGTATSGFIDLRTSLNERPSSQLGGACHRCQWVQLSQPSHHYIAQRLHSVHVTYYFQLAKIPILSHKSLGMGGYNRNTYISTKRCLLVIVRAIHATKTKTARKMSHSFGPFQFYTRRILYPRYGTPVACNVM